MQDCIFCSIASGKIESKTVYEDDDFKAFLDINPAAPGHILLIPKKHTETLMEAEDSIAQKIMIVARELSRKLLKGIKAQGTNIFIANGSAAGQKAPHLIVHIIPRVPDDGLNFVMKAQAPQTTQNEAAPSQQTEVDLDALKKVLQ